MATEHLKINDFNPQKSEQLKTKLIQSYPHVLSGEFPFSGMRGDKMEIYLSEKVDQRPTKVLTARAIPINYCDEADKLINKMLAEGIITPVTTPTDWCAPAFFIPKTGGGLWLVTDFTGLNRRVRQPIHPFPSPLEIIAGLNPKSTVFAKLDLLSGYHQIELTEKASYYTTFLLPSGMYRYLRAPMGLSSSSDEFCCHSDNILSGIPGVRKIVDDGLKEGTENWSSFISKLQDLLRKDVVFQWLPDHMKEFESIKNSLVRELSIQHFDQSLTTRLFTDASKLNGLGFVLVQTEDGDAKLLRILQCGSRSLSAAECNYATVELECLAIQWAMHKCDHFLRGLQKFCVMTDHWPLVGLFSKPLSEVNNPWLLCLREKTVAYSFELQWLPRKANIIADTFSQFPTKSVRVETNHISSCLLGTSKLVKK